MSTPRIIYLLLAIAGLVMTWRYNLQFMSESGGSFDLAAFIAATNTNAAATSLSWDLAVSCIAGLVFIFLESRRLNLPFFWVYILLAFTIAWAFAFPLFLFFRQGRLDALRKGSTGPAAATPG